MKKILSIISQIPKYASYSFSMSIIVFLAVSAAFGIEAISTGMLLQLLVLCVTASILQMAAFTNLIFKKLSYIKRLAVFMFPFLFVITGFAVGFQWFPIENIISWIIFLAIFIFCFIVSAVLFEIHFRITGDKYTGILNEYKNKNKKK